MFDSSIAQFSFPGSIRRRATRAVHRSHVAGTRSVVERRVPGRKAENQQQEGKSQLSRHLLSPFIDFSIAQFSSVDSVRRRAARAVHRSHVASTRSVVERRVPGCKAEDQQQQGNSQFSRHFSISWLGLRRFCFARLEIVYLRRIVCEENHYRIGGRGKPPLPFKGERLTSNVSGLKSPDVTPVNEIASALVSTDPVDQVGRVLSRFLEHTRAGGGAVVVPGHDAPRVLVARNLVLPSLENLPTLWHKHEKTLRAGRSAGRDGQRVLPLLDGADLVGALYVEGGTTESLRMRGFLEVLARAVLAATDPEALRAFGADLLGVGVERSKREITLASLRQHEWNISRVARELGLTRRTIYLRLTRWGIVRERVPKTSRRFVAEGV